MLRHGRLVPERLVTHLAAIEGIDVDRLPATTGHSDPYADVRAADPAPRRDGCARGALVEAAMMRQPEVGLLEREPQRLRTRVQALIERAGHLLPGRLKIPV